MVTECDATLTIGESGPVDDFGFHYCVVDDILHIYFDRNKVLEVLDGMESGVYTATVEVSINGGAAYQVTDDVELIDPDDDKGNK